jgi:hypothetical protein
LLAALLGLPWLTQRMASAAQTLAGSGETSAPPPRQYRRYRADAVILFLGISIFRRSGVGGGEASVEETSDGAGDLRTLFFAAGSDPARAHGLNRLGWIRETIREAHSVPSEVQYFGVMSASPEESLEHARKAIATPAAGHSTYSAVSGRHTSGASRSAITHFEMAADAKWFDRRIIDAAQATFREKVQWRETSWPGAGNRTPSTFLFELASLLSRRTEHTSGRYVYNEQEYLLDLDAGKPDRLLPVHGRIRNQRTGGLTTFTIWMETGSIVPVRIDYQPRSFLRLVFEAV